MMTQTVMNLNHIDSVERFDAALDALESHLARVLAGDGDDSAGAEQAAPLAFQDQIRFLTEDRDQLLADLEAERARVRRLKVANDEVSSRLEAVMGTLKDMIPAMPG